MQCRSERIACDYQPDQKSSSVPTEKPLQEWNMMRMDSVAAGTMNCREGSLLTSDRIRMSFIEYAHIASASTKGTRSVNRQNVLFRSEYNFKPSTNCGCGLLIFAPLSQAPRHLNSRVGIWWLGFVMRRTEPCHEVTEDLSSLMRW